MKVYKCIIDDGQDVFKTYLSAKSKKDLLSKYSGNGSFEKITDITGELFTSESVDMLRETLLNNGWGEPETNLISALLQEHLAKVGTI